MLETHLIETFVEVVSCGSVTAAARALDRSQPAVSHRLKQLEAAFGTPLFQKSGRGLKLTEAGLRLHDEAVDILARLRALPSMVSPPEAELRVVRLGVPHSLHERLSTSLIPLVDESPDLRVVVHAANDDQLSEDLAEGRVDLVVLSGEVPSDLAASPLFQVSVAWLPENEEDPALARALAVIESSLKGG